VPQSNQPAEDKLVEARYILTEANFIDCTSHNWTYWLDFREVTNVISVWHFVRALDQDCSCTSFGTGALQDSCLVEFAVKSDATFSSAPIPERPLQL